MSFVNNCEKIDSVITALHCIINSLAPGRCDFNFKSVISEHMLQIKFMTSTSVEIALRWMPQNTFDDKSTLVQVIAWCHQSTSLYMSQCWPRYMSPYGATRPNKLRQKSFPICHHIFRPNVGSHPWTNQWFSLEFQQQFIAFRSVTINHSTAVSWEDLRRGCFKSAMTEPGRDEYCSLYFHSCVQCWK